jgi:hypothetical protein
VSVIEEYVSDRGRRRRRQVAADPAEISRPTERDQADWRAVREALRDALGEPMFDVWFVDYALRAVSARDSALLIDGPELTLLRCLDDPRAAAEGSALTSRPSVSLGHKEVV